MSDTHHVVRDPVARVAEVGVQLRCQTLSDGNIWQVVPVTSAAAGTAARLPIRVIDRSSTFPRILFVIGSGDRYG